MKRVTLTLLVFLSFATVNGQSNNQRVITETPRNGHSIAKINGFYCIDDETKPFTGKYIELGFDNELKRESNYKIGKLNGDFIEYTKRDSIYVKSKAFYLNDIRVGKYVEYWRPNHKKLECFYNLKGQLHGTWTSFAGFSTEEAEVKGKYFNDVKDSTWTWYFRGLKPHIIQNYKLGKQEGNSVEFYENGKKKFECNYSNDYKVGTERDWYENGSEKHSAEYVNGKLTGVEYNYYENGKIESKGSYLNGAKKGKFIWYETNGTIKEETDF